jgi:hypothetical protein
MKGLVLPVSRVPVSGEEGQPTHGHQRLLQMGAHCDAHGPYPQTTSTSPKHTQLFFHSANYLPTYYLLAILWGHTTKAGKPPGCELSPLCLHVAVTPVSASPAGYHLCSACLTPKTSHSLPLHLLPRVVAPSWCPSTPGPSPKPRAQLCPLPTPLSSYIFLCHHKPRLLQVQQTSSSIRHSQTQLPWPSLSLLPTRLRSEQEQNETSFSPRGHSLPPPPQTGGGRQTNQPRPSH